MLSFSANPLPLLLLLTATAAVTLSSDTLNLLITAEFINFAIFPALLTIAVETNNPTNIFLIIPTTIFAAAETALVGLLLTQTTK